MFCINCGNQLPDTARFCIKCGTSLGAVPSAAQPRQPPPPAPSAPVPVQTPQGYYPQMPVSRPSPPPPQPTYAPPPQPAQPAYAAPPKSVYTPAPPRPAYAPPQPPPAYAPPLQPGVAAPPPQFGYAQQQPGYAPMAARPGAGGPMPPEMHWAVVMVLSWITVGLGALIWAFKEAFFIKKIDPSSKAVVLIGVSLLCMVGQVALYFMMVGATSAESLSTISMVILVLNLVIFVVALMAIFGMRSSMIRYYNSVENIGLKLSGVMTFFFNILYFQYHFSRIANWKKTGQLG